MFKVYLKLCASGHRNFKTIVQLLIDVFPKISIHLKYKFASVKTCLPSFLKRRTLSLSSSSAMAQSFI